MSKKALIVWGGWDGHQPDIVAKRFERYLKEGGVSSDVYDTLDAFADREKLMTYDLIAPIWTMGEIDSEYCENVSEAVASGVGMAGCHGGMCDAFRGSVLWQFITGGNWVSHPGGDGVEFTVEIKDSSSPLIEGINDFKVKTEHYYLLTDPGNEVLATTDFPVVPWYHSTHKKVTMPVVWTKHWGLGRVYYNALGHHDDVFDVPEAGELMKRGLLWAAESKEKAKGLSIEHLKSSAKMF
ncbi:MAG: ThuA domain-containing protein [Defluviitaleaceae bacterium]|nr:ThuA domain-containing protein [Defluviitaleaceae bacterium]